MDEELMQEEIIEEIIDDYSPAIGDTFYKAGYSLAKYSKCAMWCNTHNATIEDKGEYYECVAIPQPSDEEKLAMAKERKVLELKSARDTEEQSPILYNNYYWDFDDKAIQRINGAIIALSNGGTITWTSAENEEINEVTADDLRGVISASAVRSNALHIKYRQLREQVEQAVTLEEVEKIVW